MNERGNTRRVAKFFNATPGVMFRAMPDTGGITHKKPYDAFIIFRGRHISVECKTGYADLEDHQKEALKEDVAAGAIKLIIRYSSGGALFIFELGRVDFSVCLTWRDMADPAKIEAMLSEVVPQ